MCVCVCVCVCTCVRVCVCVCVCVYMCACVRVTCTQELVELVNEIVKHSVYNPLQFFQCIVMMQCSGQSYGSRILNFIPFKTMKESTCTQELVELVNGIVRHSVYNPLQFFK